MSLRAVAIAFFFAVGISFCAPRTALANAPAPFSRPVGAPAGMVLERPSPLVVEHEELGIDCAHDPAAVHTKCEFTAVYSLFNPTGAVEEVLGAFYTVEPTPSSPDSVPATEAPANVSATIDGRSANAEATPEQVDVMDRLVLADADIAREVDKFHELARRAFRIVVEPGARAQLTFHGELKPSHYQDERERQGYTLSPILTRHVIFSPNDVSGRGLTAEDYFYPVSPLSTWAGDPDVRIAVRHHVATRFSSSSEGARWTSNTELGVTTEGLTMRVSARKNLRFRLENKPFPFINGGPLIGVGARIAREEARVRIGYELAGPDYIIYGLAGETNFNEYFTGVFTVEAASPDVFAIFPSFALGLGVPVQFRKSEPTRVGVRGEFTISFPLLSFVFPLDVYPAPNSSGSRVEGSFITQLSF